MASPKVTNITEAQRSLKERIAQVAGQAAAPSMVPAQTVPPPPKETVPALSDIVQDKKDMLLLKRLIEQSVELADEEQALRKKREPLTKQIKNLLGKYEISKAECDDIHVSYYTVPRSSIKADKLLELGVLPAVIAKATVTTESYTLRISRRGEDEES